MLKTSAILLICVPPKQHWLRVLHIPQSLQWIILRLKQSAFSSGHCRINLCSCRRVNSQLTTVIEREVGQIIKKQDIIQRPYLFKYEMSSFFDTGNLQKKKRALSYICTLRKYCTDVSFFYITSSTLHVTFSGQTMWPFCRILSLSVKGHGRGFTSKWHQCYNM
jgi:hypothetical protein